MMACESVCKRIRDMCHGYPLKENRPSLKIYSPNLAFDLLVAHEHKECLCITSFITMNRFNTNTKKTQLDVHQRFKSLILLQTHAIRNYPTTIITFQLSYGSILCILRCHEYNSLLLEQSVADAGSREIHRVMEPSLLWMIEISREGLGIPFRVNLFKLRSIFRSSDICIIAIILFFTQNRC